MKSFIFDGNHFDHRCQLDFFSVLPSAFRIVPLAPRAWLQSSRRCQLVGIVQTLPPTSPTIWNTGNSAYFLRSTHLRFQTRSLGVTVIRRSFFGLHKECSWLAKCGWARSRDETIILTTGSATKFAERRVPIPSWYPTLSRMGEKPPILLPSWRLKCQLLDDFFEKLSNRRRLLLENIAEYGVNPLTVKVYGESRLSVCSYSGPSGPFNPDFLDDASRCLQSNRYNRLARQIANLVKPLVGRNS